MAKYGVFNSRTRKIVGELCKRDDGTYYVDTVDAQVDLNMAFNDFEGCEFTLTLNDAMDSE